MLLLAIISAVKHDDTVYLQYLAWSSTFCQPLDCFAIKTFYYFFQDTEDLLKKEAKLNDEDGKVEPTQTPSQVSHALAAYKR